MGKIEQKLPKMMNYISNLQFGEKFMKIRPKIEKLQMFKFTSSNIQCTCNAKRKALH